VNGVAQPHGVLANHVSSWRTLAKQERQETNKCIDQVLGGAGAREEIGLCCS